MTGARARRAREALMLEPYPFAMLMHVHVSTIYRWESARRVVMSRPHDDIYVALLAYEEGKRGKQLSDLGDALHSELIHRGALAALSLLLTTIVTIPGQ